jgi:hypothetical protein
LFKPDADKFRDFDFSMGLAASSHDCAKRRTWSCFKSGFKSATHAAARLAETFPVRAVRSRQQNMPKGAVRA